MSRRVGLIDPFAGIAGDMFVGALIDAGAPLERIREGLSRLDPQIDAVESDEGTVALGQTERLDCRGGTGRVGHGLSRGGSAAGWRSGSEACRSASISRS